MQPKGCWFLKFKFFKKNQLIFDIYQQIFLSARRALLCFRCFWPFLSLFQFSWVFFIYLYLSHFLTFLSPFPVFPSLFPNLSQFQLIWVFFLLFWVFFPNFLSLFHTFVSHVLFFWVFFFFFPDFVTPSLSESFSWFSESFSLLQHFSELFVDFSELFVNLTDLNVDWTRISLERFYYKSMQCMYGKWIIYGYQFPLSSNFKTIFILVKKAIKIIQFRVLVKSVPSFERFHPQLVWGFLYKILKLFLRMISITQLTRIQIILNTVFLAQLVNFIH